MGEAQFMDLKDKVGASIIDWLNSQEAMGVSGNDALEGLVKVMMGYGAFYGSMLMDRDEYLRATSVAYSIFDHEGETLQ